MPNCFKQFREMLEEQFNSQIVQLKSHADPQVLVKDAQDDSCGWTTIALLLQETGEKKKGEGTY